jgi:hypothetical protein
MENQNQHLEKISDYVTITVEHHFTDEELLRKSSELAGLTAEIEVQEQKKKATASEYKNKIDGLKAQAKLIASNINNKWENQERACELYLDFEKKLRLYDDKITGDHLKTEPFHQSDFEKRQLKMNLEQQIEENNEAGEFAEKPTPKDNLHPHYGKDFEQGDALDEVIKEKKAGKAKKPHAEDFLIGDGLTHDRHGNLTDIPGLSDDNDEDLEE